jgi:hypothetical protein
VELPDSAQSNAGESGETAVVGRGAATAESGDLGSAPRFDRAFLERLQREVAERRRQEPGYSFARALRGRSIAVPGRVFAVSLPDGRILNPTRYSVIVIPSTIPPGARMSASEMFTCGFALTDESAKNLQPGQSVVIEGRVIAIHMSSSRANEPPALGLALDDCVLVSTH